MGRRRLRGLRVLIAALLILIMPLIPGLPDRGSPVHAQDVDPAEVPAHLGYGIHYGPNTDVGGALVNDLGFDWVKIYQLEHAAAFPRQRVLLRIDIGWQGDWDAFKRNFSGYIREVANRNVEAVEIHNEPNLSHEWNNGVPNAWQYVQVLRVAYTIIKDIKPGLIVVSGGLAPTVTTADRRAISDLEFAREMFENGAGQWFDVFGYHPYGYNAPPEADPFGAQPLVFRRTERIRALMEEYGIYKQIWLTEFGWLRDPNEEGIGCTDNNPDFAGFAWMRVSGTQQGDYLVRAFDYAHLNWPWAGPMFVWNLNWQQMGWLPVCSHMRWFGLLRPSGEPTPAFRRLAGMKKYYSDYLPRIEIKTETLQAEISLICPKVAELGTFTIQNTGYPAYVEFVVQPMNASPPYIEAQPTKAAPGVPIRLFVTPGGLDTPGLYPVYINVRGTLRGRPVSQSLQGIVNVWHFEKGC